MYALVTEKCTSMLSLSDLGPFFILTSLLIDRLVKQSIFMLQTFELVLQFILYLLIINETSRSNVSLLLCDSLVKRLQKES